MDEYLLKALFDRLLCIGGAEHGKFRFLRKKSDRLWTDHGTYARQEILLGNLENVTVLVWEG